MSWTPQRGPEGGALLASVFVCVGVGESVCGWQQRQSVYCTIWITNTDLTVIWQEEEHQTEQQKTCVVSWTRYPAHFIKVLLVVSTAAAPTCPDLLWHHSRKRHCHPSPLLQQELGDMAHVWSPHKLPASCALSNVILSHGTDKSADLYMFVPKIFSSECNAIALVF